MPTFNKVNDSGERRTFSTGSVRDQAKGKGKPALMPVLALLRVAKHYENGAEKYGDRNWELGQPHLDYAHALFRHLLKYLGGAKDEDHIAAVAWNALAIMQQEDLIERGLLPAELDNVRVSFDKNGNRIEIPACLFLPEDDPYLTSPKSDPPKKSKKRTVKR